MNKLGKVPFIICIVLVIGILVAIIMSSFIAKYNQNLSGYSKYLIIGKDNLIAVYDDKLAIKIPMEIQVDNVRSFRDVVNTGNYDEVLVDVNRILPERIDIYRRIKYGNVELKVASHKNIPETTVDDKRHVLTSEVYEMFKAYYAKIEAPKNENGVTVEGDTTKKSDVKQVDGLIVDILNGNGKTGYAGIVGDRLKKKFDVKYNAATNKTQESGYSYIVLSDIPANKAAEMVMALDEKYIKVKESAPLPTLANVVLILGKETKIDLGITIVSPEKDKVQKASATLSKAGYKNIKTDVSNVKVENSIIEYGPDNYFIAYKISKKLSIQKLFENKELGNNIKVMIVPEKVVTEKN